MPFPQIFWLRFGLDVYLISFIYLLIYLWNLFVIVDGSWTRELHVKTNSLIPLFIFSGLGQDDSEFIDIPDDMNRDAMLKAFGRVGFVRQMRTSRSYKLLPCPLGTFIDPSASVFHCSACPAGELPRL